MFGDTLLHALHAPSPTPLTIVLYLVVGAAVALVVEVIASKNVNINRFSLHAVYRNRLVRGYLGAARQARNPDRFTGFDDSDNIHVHKLWPPQATSDGQNTFGLFHVLNISLNVVEAKRLAWQERKAEPFTVSPRHCGSALKGFRPSCEYAGKEAGGITLGTAMAISGAAVSPNMGYYSSPSISLLLAFFNVRLGWWLGNPGWQGNDSYATEGPDFAIRPLLQEAFGLTTDDKRYVYLSDGGHFEDLGLYEMVRRRCRFIVVVDAGEDAHFAFDDLGNAIRKIYIDLGIRIDFTGLQDLRNRPPRAAVGEPQQTSRTTPLASSTTRRPTATAAAMERSSTSNRPCIGPSPPGSRAMRPLTRLFPTRQRLISGSLNLSSKATARSDSRSRKIFWTNSLRTGRTSHYPAQPR